jgi:hypothetical protein
MKKLTLGLFITSALAAVFFCGFYLFKGATSLPDLLMLYAAIPLFIISGVLWVLEWKQVSLPWRLALRVLVVFALILWISVFVVWLRAQGDGGAEQGIIDALENLGL